MFELFYIRLALMLAFSQAFDHLYIQKPLIIRRLRIRFVRKFKARGILNKKNPKQRLYRRKVF